MHRFEGMMFGAAFAFAGLLALIAMAPPASPEAVRLSAAGQSCPISDTEGACR